MFLDLKITGKKMKPFMGDEGDQIDYYWYSAERLDNQATIKFGSMDPNKEIGETIQQLKLEKTERVSRKGTGTIFVYKEILN